jgi:pimeloyl-ACP methyl ester carboxylesterase
MKPLLRVLLALLLAVLLLVFVLTTIGAFYEPNIQIPSDLLGQHLSVNGLPVRVYQRGQGPDVLLIHGSPGSLEDFAPIFNALGARYRLSAYDRPGHGYSGDSGKYSPADNAELAETLLEQLGLHDAIVVGHSYGGSTALALALRKPARARAFVVLDSATYAPLRALPPLYQVLGIPYLGLGCASVLGSFIAPTRIRSELQNIWHDAPDEFITLRTRIWSTPKVSHALARESLEARAALGAQSPRYPEVQQPVSILAQADDAKRKSNAERLHRDIAGSTLELLSGTGHYLQFEKTAEVVRAIEQLVPVPVKEDEEDLQ